MTKKYCTRCGREMIMYERHMYYDEDTGNSVKENRGRCPRFHTDVSFDFEEVTRVS